MNRRRSKRLEKHATTLLVSWLKGLLEEEEASKITVETYKSFLPTQTHYMAGRTMFLNAYHPKWIKKKIIQLLKIFPAIQIEDVNLEMITWKVNQRPAG
jgi:hypothetical protein